VSCVLFTQSAVFRVGGPIYLIPMTSKLALYAVSENQGICMSPFCFQCLCYVT